MPCWLIHSIFFIYFNISFLNSFCRESSSVKYSIESLAQFHHPNDIVSTRANFILSAETLLSPLSPLPLVGIPLTEGGPRMLTMAGVLLIGGYWDAVAVGSTRVGAIGAVPGFP